MRPSSIPKALTFDVFGTVVDWRGSIIRECRALAAVKKLDLDCAASADAWRAGYRPAMDRVRRGDLPWMKPRAAQPLPKTRFDVAAQDFLDLADKLGV
jgi:2-haloacid dehalogenase